MRTMTRLVAELVGGTSEQDSIMLEVELDQTGVRLCEGSYYGIVIWEGSRYPVELKHSGYLYFKPEESDTYQTNIFEKDIRLGELLSLNEISNGEASQYIYRISQMV